MLTKRRWLGVLLLAHAEMVPAQIVDGFAPDADSFVRALAVHPDGSVLAGGGFTQIDGVAQRGLARFGGGAVPTIEGEVIAIAVQQDGKILIGGIFSKVGNETRTNIARLHANGVLDAAFTASATNSVRGIAVQPDGRIVIVGGFSSVNGTTQRLVARLNGDGSLDGTFDADPDHGALVAVAVQPDGRVLIGGGFEAIGGVPQRGLARLEPSGVLDTSFAVSVNDTVEEIVIRQDGEIFVGGAFTTIAGSTCANLARVTPEGSLGECFDANGWVNAVAVQPDGAVLVGGQFTAVAGVARAGFARIMVSGEIDASFTADADGGVPLALAVQADAYIFAGGNFTQINGTVRNRLARLAPNGLLDASLTASFAPQPRALATQSDGAFIVGSFTAIGSAAAVRRVLVNGELDPTFVVTVDGPVSGLAVQRDGKVLLAGDFEAVNGAARQHLARVTSTGVLDGSFVPAIDGEVVAVRELDDGRILIVGRFVSVGSATQPSIALLRHDGTLDTSFSPPIPSGPTGMGTFPALVYCAAPEPGGSVVIGGSFTRVGAVTRNYIARLGPDGALDATFDPSPNGHVYAIARQRSGEFAIGGTFTLVGGRQRLRAARIGQNGNVDEAWVYDVNASDPDLPPLNNPTQNGAVYSVASFADDSLLLAGDFSEVNFTSNENVALIPAVGQESMFDGANDVVAAAAVLPDGKVVLAGDFSIIFGESRTGVARVRFGNAREQLTAAVGSALLIRAGLAPEFSVPPRIAVAPPTGIYVDVGAMTSVPGGWASVSLPIFPTRTVLRVRTSGPLASGVANGSQGRLSREWLVVTPGDQAFSDSFE